MRAEIDVEDEQVKLIRGDRDDVWSKGYLCPKGTTLGHLHDDPDRLRAADGARRRHVARGVVGRGVRALRGAARTACRPSTASTRSTAYVGNPVGHSFTLEPLRRRRSSGMSGMPIIYSSGTVDQWPKNVSVAS